MTGTPQEVSLAVGEHHELELPGLGPAGYRWDEQVTGDEDAVALEWRRGVSAEEARGRPIGAGAPERLTVTARRPGRVRIELSQRRPWEDKLAVAEQVVLVEVRPA